MNAKFRQARGLLRREWGRVTDDRATQLRGEMDALIGHLQEKYGYTRSEAGEKARKFFEEQIQALKESIQDHLPEMEIHPSRATRARQRRRRMTWIRRTMIGLGMVVAAIFVVRSFLGHGRSQPPRQHRPEACSG